VSNAQAKSVAVIGAGTMGAGIAQSFAQAGFDVALVDQSQAALERALATIETNLAQLDEFGLVEGDVAANLHRVTPKQATSDLAGMQKLRMVVETVSEDLQLKRSVFAELDGLNDAVILASNTSSMTMSAIAEGMRSAHRTVGLHYFNPAHIIPAVEIHRGEATSDEAVATARQLVESTGKIPVIVRKEIPGFVINRLTGALEREVDYLLDEGVVTPEDLDKAVKASFGFRLACLGPMEAEDMIGLDISARVGGNLFKTLSNATETSPGLIEKVERGELGVKSGRGWYDYPEDKVRAILEERNARLLRQLAVFRSREDTKGDES